MKMAFLCISGLMGTSASPKRSKSIQGIDARVHGKADVLVMKVPVAVKVITIDDLCEHFSGHGVLPPR